MNKKIVLSFITVALLFSGCGSESTQETGVSQGSGFQTQTSVTGAPLDFSATTSRLKKALAQAESKVARESNARHAEANEAIALPPVYLGDLVYDLITVEDNSLSGENMTPFYDYFKANVIDAGVLSAEDQEVYDRVPSSSFYSWFKIEYFEEFGDRKASFYTPRVMKYLTSLDLDLSDATRELVKEQLLLISFDSETLSDTVLDEPKMASAFLQTRKKYPEFEQKIVGAFHFDDWKIASSILDFMDYTDEAGTALRDEQQAYHLSHMSKEMYDAMVGAAFKNPIITSQLSKVLFRVNKEKNLTLPTDDGAQSFPNAFFDIGSEIHGDGNELITERLMFVLYRYMLTYDDMLYTFGALEEETSLAYLDFMFLGKVPDADENRLQAHFNTYARAAGEASLTRSLDFGESLWFLKVKTATLKDNIPTSRYFSYLKENIIASYYYYTNEINASEDLKAQEQLSWDTSEAEREAGYPAYIETQSANAPSRSGSNIFEQAYAALESLWLEISTYFENFSLDLSLIGQKDENNEVNSTVVIDGDRYELPDTNATTTTVASEIVMGDYVASLANAEVDYSNSQYVNYTPYSETGVWDYMPASISTLHWVSEDSFSSDANLTFNFHEGEVEVYLISRGEMIQTQEGVETPYSLEEVPLGSDALSSENDTAYSVYKFSVKSGESVRVSDLPLSDISGMAFNINFASFMVEE